MRTTHFILGFLFVFFSACSESNPETDVQGLSGDENTGLHGGSPVDSRESLAKSAGFLLIARDASKPDVSFCSGTLIGPDLFLTAAHCFNSIKDSDLHWKAVVVFGSHADLTKFDHKKSTYREATSFVVHPTYRPSGPAGFKNDDLALVKLASPAPGPLAPAKLLIGALKKGDKVIIAGHGPSDKETDSGTLRKVSSRIVDVGTSKTSVSVSNLDRTGTRPGDSGCGVWKNVNEKPQLWGLMTSSNSKSGGPVYSFVIDLRTQLPWLKKASKELGTELR